jgi:hypothetical protein
MVPPLGTVWLHQAAPAEEADASGGAEVVDG